RVPPSTWATTCTTSRARWRPGRPASRCSRAAAPGRSSSRRAPTWCSTTSGISLRGWTRRSSRLSGRSDGPSGGQGGRFETVPTGKVKWYDAEKGFGFLSQEDGPDVYVRAEALPEGVTTLKAGQRV